MPENQPQKPAPRSLTVLPSSGKLEELRAKPAPTAGARFDPSPDPTLTPAQNDLRERVVAAIRTVYDPELPVNIFDLGLIYSLEVSPENGVRVTMTLTAPGCPVAGTLPGEVQRKIGSVEGVTSAAVELVWEPSWDKSRMSEEALLELGML